MKQIEDWTGLKYGNILFDSEIDNWERYTSVFNDRIVGKKQLIFLIEENEGEKFGYYCNTEIVHQSNEWIPTDSQSFHFNLFSNERLPKPMKFEVINPNCCGYCLSDQSFVYLIEIGDIHLYKVNQKDECYCEQHDDRFDYHGFEDALCGNSPGKPFDLKKMVIIQMK